ncbi:hypothetical protein DH2020_009654 [Rehmannia glutinosa]|uniref:Uncharacterized protein n=1 Tax=Rehmannia glutinosa TaxID=99300 RepID=A0ABR0X6Z4_REHGL
MGSCVSVHKHPESAMKLRLSIGSKNEKLLIPSPVKEKNETVNDGDRTVADVVLKSQWSPPRFVDADFTPSRGNTPVHHSFSPGNPRANNARVVEGTNGSLPEPSPPDKKKRLSELFKESLRNNEYADEASSKVVPEATSLIQRTKSTDGTPYISGANSRVSSETTPNREVGEEEKSLKSGQCCFPRLISSRSFSERKKSMSPAQKSASG